MPMGFGGLGTGCSKARTHKPSPKTSRCSWHSTEGQTGPYSRLTHGTAASLPWPHITPGMGGSAPQSASHPAAAQLPTAKHCRAKMSEATALGKGNTGQRDFTVKGVLLPWPPAPAATELSQA